MEYTLESVQEKLKELETLHMHKNFDGNGEDVSEDIKHTNASFFELRLSANSFDIKHKVNVQTLIWENGEVVDMDEEIYQVTWEADDLGRLQDILDYLESKEAINKFQKLHNKFDFLENGFMDTTVITSAFFEAYHEMEDYREIYIYDDVDSYGNDEDDEDERTGTLKIV